MPFGIAASNDPSKDILAGIALITVFSACYVIQRDDFPQLTRKAATMFRQRCAMVICLGLAILAVSFLFDLRASYEYKIWNDFVRDKWLPAFGAALTLIGVYHWLARADIK